MRTWRHALRGTAGEKPGCAINKLRPPVHVHALETCCGGANTWWGEISFQQMIALITMLPADREPIPTQVILTAIPGSARSTAARATDLRDRRQHCLRAGNLVELPQDGREVVAVSLEDQLAVRA
jgi:hypothetical protein